MSSAILEVKENVNFTHVSPKTETTSQAPSSSNYNSILKTSQKENIPAPFNQLSPKKGPKVSFKNTPIRHKPERYRAELLSRLDTWEEIRHLDEEENWTERTQVVTKEDHQLYLEAAKVFLEEIISNLPIKVLSSEPKEEPVALDMSSPEKIKSPKSPVKIVKPIKGGIKSPPIPTCMESEFPAFTDDPEPLMAETDLINSPGPLDPVIASMDSYLSVNNDVPKTFSPIGSERTSPEADNMIGSQEDLDKLLSPHEDIPDEDPLPVLNIHSHTSTDAASTADMTSTISHDNDAISPSESHTTEASIEDEEMSLPCRPRGYKPGNKEIENTNEALETPEEFTKPCRPRGFKPPTEDIDNTNEALEIPEELTEPCKPRVSKPPVKKTSNSPDKDAEKFKKPLPPKPWKVKKKKAAQEGAPFAVVFPGDGNKNTDTILTDGSTAPESDANLSTEFSKCEEKPKVNGLEEGTSKGSVMEDNFQGSELPESQQEDLGLGDDDFKSAGDAFSLELDYLEKFGNSANMDKLMEILWKVVERHKYNHESALARQSLYVKFDPLVKGASPEAISKMKPDALNRKVIPNLGEDLFLINTPPSSKAPVSRVAAAGGRGKARDSPVSVDKLLTFSPSGKPSEDQTTDDYQHVAHEEKKETVSSEPATEDKHRKSAHGETNLVQPLLFDKSDIEAALKKERDALLQQANEESAIRDMEIQEISKKCQAQALDIDKLRRENDELRTVMNEYERTMAEMIENSKKSQTVLDNSKSEVIKERDQLQADLNSVEAAFSDLHRRYEKVKGVVENFKKNEEILKKAARDYQEKLRKSEEKYQLLKKHAEEKIETANVEINRVRRSNDSEMAVMRAALKKEQTKVSSLEQAVQQKVDENKELTAICDELIQRASTSN